MLAALPLSVMLPASSIADEALEQLYKFITDHSPKYHVMHPEGSLVGDSKYNSSAVRFDPKLKIVTDAVLQDMKLIGHGTADALYEVETATIYLSDRIDLNTAYGQSVLLHELVLHVQHQMDLDEIACGYSFVEDDAYTVQAEYLKQHGDEAWEAIRTLGIMRSGMGERCLLDLIMNGE